VLVDRGRPDRFRYRLRDRVVGAVLPLALALVRGLPRGALAPVGRCAALLYRTLARRDMAILRRNLELVLGLAPSSPEWRAMRRRVTEQQVHTSLETVREILVPGSVQLTTGQDELARVVKEAEKAGRGFILITGHLGSWELVIRLVSGVTRGRFHVLAKRSRIAPVTALLESLRERIGARVLWTDQRSLPREMLAVLRRGDALGFAMDQKPRWYQGPVVELFGLPTEMPGGAAALTARTQCPVIAVFCVRLGPFRYRLLAEQILGAEHGEHDPQALTQAMAAAIERAIRAYPDQWCWTYKRWLFDEQGRLRRGGAQARGSGAEHEARR
jgi:KDO2-lipid IV(A) lauroyltransferase